MLVIITSKVRTVKEKSSPLITTRLRYAFEATGRQAYALTHLRIDLYVYDLQHYSLNWTGKGEA